MFSKAARSNMRVLRMFFYDNILILLSLGKLQAHQVINRFGACLSTFSNKVTDVT